MQAALEAAGQQQTDFEAALRRLETAEGERGQTDQERLEAEARAAAALRDRESLAGELEITREAAAAAAELRTRCDALEAERDGLERALQQSESGLETAVRERDSARAEFEATRDAARAALNDAEARCEELRGALQRRPHDMKVDWIDLQVGGDEPPAQARGETREEPKRRNSGSRRADAPRPVPEAPPNQPTRRASRHVLPDHIEVQVDGAAAILVDLSATGAQILSPTALKPNRLVKLLLPFDEGQILCKGKIVWARLEPSSASQSLRYRGGVFFSTAVEDSAVDAFIAQAVAAAPAGQSLSATTDS